MNEMKTIDPFEYRNRGCKSRPIYANYVCICLNCVLWVKELFILQWDRLRSLNRVGSFTDDG